MRRMALQETPCIPIESDLRKSTEKAHRAALHTDRGCYYSKTQLEREKATSIDEISEVIRLH